MHASSLFVIVPVALVLVTSATPSSASPTMIVNNKHHMMQNKTRSTHAEIAPMPRRTRNKHVVVEPRSLVTPVTAVLDVYLGQLSSDHDGVLSASNAFTATAKKAHSNSAHDSSYQQDCAEGLTSFRHSLDPLQSLLAQLGSDKGLANYDKSNQLETLLKDIVNSSKYALDDVDTLIYALPVLGPILGPIVYEIKCILDDLLNATENVTDGLLNSLAPLLKPLIQSTTSTVCRSISPPVADLCLPV